MTHDWFKQARDLFWDQKDDKAEAAAMRAAQDEARQQKVLEELLHGTRNVQARTTPLGPDYQYLYDADRQTIREHMLVKMLSTPAGVEKYLNG